MERRSAWLLLSPRIRTRRSNSRARTGLAVRTNEDPSYALRLGAPESKPLAEIINRNLWTVARAPIAAGNPFLDQK